MKYVCAVYESRSFSKAAESTHISQPALSQCIKKIESDLGTPIFFRTTRNVIPTEAGNILYEGCKKILANKEEMDKSLDEIINSEDTEFRVGISPFYSKHYLPYVLKNLRKAYPFVKLKIEELISEQQEEMLKSGELDFCCIPQDPEIEGLIYEPICMEEILLAVPKTSLLNGSSINASPISFLDVNYTNGQDFIALKTVQKINRLLESLFDSYNLKYKVVYETLDWDTVDIMVGNGLGIGFVPDILYKVDDRETTPMYYRTTSNSFLRRFSLAYRAGETISPQEKSIMDLFKSSIQEARANIIGRVV